MPAKWTIYRLAIAVTTIAVFLETIGAPRKW
jgi:hypothetical protein